MNGSYPIVTRFFAIESRCASWIFEIETTHTNYTKVMTRTIPFLFSALLLLGFIAPVQEASANDADKKISLSPSPLYPSAKGKAKYRDRGDEQEFQVEVEKIRSLSGQTVTIVVDGVAVGTAKVSISGKARYEVNSDRGGNVPVIEPGSTVVVRTAAEVVIVSGHF
jgi:hypothetical protein